MVFTSHTNRLNVSKKMSQNNKIKWYELIFIIFSLIHQKIYFSRSLLVLFCIFNGRFSYFFFSRSVLGLGNKIFNEYWVFSPIFSSNNFSLMMSLYTFSLFLFFEELICVFSLSALMIWFWLTILPTLFFRLVFALGRFLGLGYLVMGKSKISFSLLGMIF